jgi:hypothetical protein
MRDLAGVQEPKGGQGPQGLLRGAKRGQGRLGVLQKGGQGRQGVLQKGGQRRLGVLQKGGQGRLGDLQKGGQGRLGVLQKGKSGVARSWSICVSSNLNSSSEYQVG